MARLLVLSLLPLGSVLASGGNSTEAIARPDGGAAMTGPTQELLGSWNSSREEEAEPPADFGIDLVDEDDNGDLSTQWLSQVAAQDVSVRADNAGTAIMFGNEQMRRACGEVCSGGLEAWYVNKDLPGYPRYPAYIATGPVAWGRTTSRSFGTAQVNRQTVSNELDVTVTQEVRVTSSHASSVAMSITNSIEVGTEISVEVGIPELFKVGTKTSFTASTSDTKTQTDTETLGSWNTISTPVPPKSSVCASIEVNHETHEVDFAVKVCYQGWFRCDYGGNRCNGHLVWWGNFARYFGTSACKIMRGHMVGNRYTVGRGRVTPGACPRLLSGDDGEEGGVAGTDSNGTMPTSQGSEPPLVV